MQQQQQQAAMMMQQAMMMMPSPAALSSPSTGYVSSRASPLFSGGGDNSNTPPPVLQQVVEYPKPAASTDEEAPPKQLASALESLNNFVRLIADVRSGGDALLEAVEAADQLRCRDLNNGSRGHHAVVVKEIESTKATLEQLRAAGRELELSGLLQQQPQQSSPLICPDGTVVSYSWKRQIAGQAAASAVERTRLALRAFTEQKKRFLPHIDDQQGDTAAKRRRRCQEQLLPPVAPSLAEVLKLVQTDCPGMLVVERQHRFSSSSSSFQQHENAILELLIPGTLRAVISVQRSLPDALAVFSPDETSEHLDAWGTSAYSVYQRVSHCGSSAMQHYTRMINDSGSPLLSLLQWFFGYRTLFSKPCSKCNRLLALDASSNLLLPPIVRPLLAKKTSGTEEADAYHCGCLD